MDVVTLGAALKGAKAYTDATISPLLGGVHYRGSVNYFNNLPSNPSEGDAYTVKYSGTSGTSPDGTEYVWALDTDDNTYKWIGFSPDTYTKTEVDNLLNGKQATIDSSHKLSSDLVDDSNSTNKFATAAQLEQIETNKTNISSFHKATGTDIYFTETEPTGNITKGSYWISTTATKKYVSSNQLFNADDTNLYFFNTKLSTYQKWDIAADALTVRIPCQPSTTYTISYTATDTDMTIWRINTVSVDDTPTGNLPVTTTEIIETSKPVNKKTTFTTNADAKYILIQTNANISTDIYMSLMLNLGDTAMSYEQYVHEWQ